MMKLKISAITLLAGLLLASCTTTYEKLINSPDVQEKYQGAFMYFNAKKYTRSVELFESILVGVKGTLQEDTVQYYLGLSNYKLGDLTTAEANFDQFIQVFPRSPFTEEAKFLRIDCLYKSTYRFELDQVPTYKALSVINEFVYEHPKSVHIEKCKDMMKDLQERLDRKSYEAAKLYFKIEDYKAAVYALKNALKDNPDNSYREDIMYYIVAANYQFAQNSIPAKQKERFLTLIDEYYNFISEFPESHYRKELDSMFKKAQEVTNKK